LFYNASFGKDLSNSVGVAKIVISINRSITLMIDYLVNQSIVAALMYAFTYNI